MLGKHSPNGTTPLVQMEASLPKDGRRDVVCFDALWERKESDTRTPKSQKSKSQERDLRICDTSS